MTRCALRTGRWVLLVAAVMTLVSAPRCAAAQTRLVAFVGSASKPPMEACKRAYEKLHPDVAVDMTFSGSGTLLNQMVLEEMGDLYIPGSDDYMDKAAAQRAILPATRKIICYLVPMICVQHGNPKHIRTLQDLARPGMSVGLAKAGAVCLGDVSEQILVSAGLLEAVRKNVLTYAASCEQTQQLLQLQEVDAIIGWDSFKAWAPEKIDLVPLEAKYVRVRNIPAAVSVYSKEPRAAVAFIKFLTSTQGSEIFARHGYAVHPPHLTPDTRQQPGPQPRARK